MCQIRLSPLKEIRNHSASYFFDTCDAMSIYDAVVNLTDDHELACEIAGWADLAGVGEAYETDTIFAEIVDD